MSTRKVSSGRKRALWVVGGTEVTPIGGVVTSGDAKEISHFPPHSYMLQARTSAVLMQSVED